MIILLEELMVYKLVLRIKAVHHVLVYEAFDWNCRSTNCFLLLSKCDLLVVIYFALGIAAFGAQASDVSLLSSVC